MLELEEIILDRYHIKRRLSRGGMSEVYLAYDEHMHRYVAIKFADSYYTDNVRRLQREAKMMEQLTHSHILPTFEHGEYRTWHYIVMPYIANGTLRQRLLKDPLTLEEAGNILEQIAEALQFAHDHGILHRDIKASNILFADEKHAYLADFGLAKMMDGASDITQVGCLIGTPEYMAPELADGKVSTSSDIYALGILLYQMLTGQVPFTGGAPLSVYWKHIREQPVPPSQLNPAIPYEVEQVILCALEKDPRLRFKTPLAMAQAYQQALRASSQTGVVQVLAQTATLSQVTYYKLNTRTTEPFVQRPVSDRHPQYRVGLATLLLVMLMLVTPLTINFFEAQSHLQAQVPLLLGTDAHYTGASSRPSHNRPSPVTSGNLAPLQGEQQATFNTIQRIETPSYQPPPAHKKIQKHKHKHDQNGNGSNGIPNTLNSGKGPLPPVYA